MSPDGEREGDLAETWAMLEHFEKFLNGEISQYESDYTQFLKDINQTRQPAPATRREFERRAAELQVRRHLLRFFIKIYKKAIKYAGENTDHPSNLEYKELVEKFRESRGEINSGH